MHFRMHSNECTNNQRGLYTCALGRAQVDANRSSVAAEGEERRADKFTFEKNFMGIGQLHAKKEEEKKRLCRMHVVLRCGMRTYSSTSIMELGGRSSRIKEACH